MWECVPFMCYVDEFSFSNSQKTVLGNSIDTVHLLTFFFSISSFVFKRCDLFAFLVLKSCSWLMESELPEGVEAS